MKLDVYHAKCLKGNSKWIKDLVVRPENIKYIEGNIGKTLYGILWFCSIFLAFDSMAKQTQKYMGL